MRLGNRFNLCARTGITLLANVFMGILLLSPQTGFAQDKIYWTQLGTDRIERADRDGSNIEVLLSSIGYPQGIALDVAAGKMYWADTRTDKIHRANLDGTSVENLVTSGLLDPFGLALDIAAGKMYWTDNGTDKIQRANLDGTSVEDLIIAGLVDPFGIALDVSAGKIYWTDNGTDKIQRANLDGTGVEDLIITGIVDPSGLALDVAAGKMYWTDTGTNKIQRANLDGTSVEELIAHTAPISGIALDVAAGKMYWTEIFSDKIQRANLDGTGIEDLVTGLSQLYLGFALDVTAGKMYWTDTGVPTIQRANFDGTIVEDLINGFFPNGIALDVAAGKMYWTENNFRRIQRANLDGTGVVDLVTTGLSVPCGIALEIVAGKMYWIDAGTGRIQRANLDGTNVETLVTGIFAQSGIALDVAAGKMYWTNRSANKVQRANLDGTSVEDLVIGLTSPYDIPLGIALDVAAGKMYWTAEKIRRANLDGTGVEDLVTGLVSPSYIALDIAAGKMYWTDQFAHKIQRANFDGTGAEDLVTSTSGLSYPLGITLDVPIASLTKPFVFLANKVTLKRTEQSTPAGDMHSNGTLTVEKGDPSTYNSNLTAVGKITIFKDNTINGDVTSATAISNSGTINGNATIAPVDPEPLPNKSYSAGGPNKTVLQNGTLSLAPGSYNRVTLNSFSTLKLTSGDYFLNELRYSSTVTSAVIEIDLTSSDPVNIYVVNLLQLGKEVEIRLLPNGQADSKLVTFCTLQSVQVTVGREAYFLGTLNAQNAKVVLAKNSQLRGSICAKEILVERDCLFLHHDSPGSLPGPENLPKESDVEESEVTSNQGPVTIYQLEQNHPNPFNPDTEIRFQLPKPGHVVLKIFNILGAEVRTLADAPYEAGYHRVRWDGKDKNGKLVASGVYLYQLRAGSFSQVKKMSLLR